MRTEDGSIIQQCLNGDPSAFGMLVDKYKAGVYAFVYDKLRHFQDAQDVTQKVFVKAYLSLRTLRNWESFTFWLFRIARNLCKDWIRDQSRRPDREFIEDQDPEILEVYSLNLYRENQMYEPLQEALDSLPDSYREVLLLHYFGGMTIKDMARSLGTSPTAIGMRLSRARAHLREEMMTTMGPAFRGQKLKSTFTFRVIEAVKRIKIPPMPRVAGLPWGLSLAVGIIVTVLGLNPHMSITSDMFIATTGSPLAVESKVLENGEISVDILKTSAISVISSKQSDGNAGVLKNASMLAPQQDGGGTWTKKADMPTERAEVSTCAVNGRIYAMGGITAPPHIVLATVEEYDPVMDKWTEKANMLGARRSLSAIAVNGKIYAIGGSLGGGGGDVLSTVEEYDPATNTWIKKADMPSKRLQLSTSVVDGKIYAFGGFMGPNITYATTEEYDPATDIWTRKADMPTARWGLATGVVNGKIYAIGGGGGGSTVEEYDPVTDTWSRKSDMPTGRCALSASVVNGKIYAMGGTAKGVKVSTVEVYDPATDTWIKESDMPVAGAWFSVSVVNSKIYAIGVGGSTVLEYDIGYAVGAKGRLSTKWGEIKSN